MNRWKIPFRLITAVNVLLFGLLLPPILADTPPPDYYRGKLENIRLSRIKPAPECIGYTRDSDGDGLTDYEEENKYLTDPFQKDSDKDGTPDGAFEERGEHTRTYRAVVDLRRPWSLEDMNDFYQDARLLEKVSEEISRFEVILYPEAREKLSALPYSPADTIYTAPTFAKNYSPEMAAAIRSKVKSARTDLQALTILQRELNRASTYVNLKDNLGFTTDLPLQFQYYRNSKGELIQRYYGYPTTYSLEEILDRLYFADSMYRQGTRGACSSSATLRGALFRAAGLEERTVFTIPLFYCATGDGTEINLNHTPAEHNLNRSERPGISDHFFNEVKIGERWIRVDTGQIDTGVHGPYVKLLSLHDQSDADWEVWNYGEYWKKRPYRYLLIEERE